MAIQTYDNFVLENKMTELLNTQANIHALFTIDESLATDAGLKKVINKYTYSGTVEKLTKGAKNTIKGSINRVTSEYEVERYQQTFVYNDMDIMKDPYILDSALDGISKTMANEIRTEYFAELAKISNSMEYTTFSYDTIVDALAEIGKEVEDDLFIVMGLDAKAQIRKDPDYKASRQGEILYTGQFGDICGVPVIVSKAVPAGEAYLASREATTCFVKKGSEVEQERDANTRQNKVYARKVMLIALTDANKVVKITASAE